MSLDSTAVIAENEPIVPDSAWHVLHLFYHVDHNQWSVLSEPEKLEAKTQFAELAQEIRLHPDTQLLTISVVSPKADFGCMIVTPDLQALNEFEKRLTQAFGPDLLTPIFSYLSLTDAANSHPELPDSPVVGFFNVHTRRNIESTYYDLEAKQRADLLEKFDSGVAESGKTRQIRSLGIGLDDAEWGITQFARDSAMLQSMVANLRFSELGSRYLDFGETFVGIQLPLDQLFRRIGI